MARGSAATPPSAETRSARATATATWALFSGIALMMTGNGLQGSLLGVRAELEGFGLGVTGVVMACYFVGFLFGSHYAFSALATVGHIRVFAALASLASSALLIHSISITPVTWAGMRLVTGFCMAGLYVVAESWLNDLATNATRGRLLSVYMVVTMGAMAGGQFLLNAADAAGFELFVTGSVFLSLALVPVALSSTSVPPMREAKSVSLRELYAVVPTGVAVSTLVGITQGTLMGVGAVYAAAAGMSASRIALFMAAPLVGGLVFQWPIGWLSDRRPRRAVILAVAVVAAIVSAALFFVEAGSLLAVGLMFLLGGAVFPLYSLGVAYTNDWLEYEQIMGAAAVLVRMTGIGAVIGPVVTGILMGVGALRLFFVSLAVSNTVIVAFVVYAIALRDALPLERQRHFLAYPARATRAAAALLRGDR